MKRDNWCTICSREGHRAHACPDGENMRRSTEQARMLERAICKDARVLFQETAFRLNKDDSNAVLRKFLQLTGPTCDTPSLPLP